MKLLVVSCSLSPNSRSRILAKAVFDALPEGAEYLDLQDWPLPVCDGGAAYGDERAIAIKNKLMEADGIVLASPIYNFDVNSACKNLIELTGKEAWQGKVCALVCAAGGNSSYMSPMAVLNSLMLDFRTFIVPRFVYATGKQFEGDRISDPALAERVTDLAKEFARITRALRAT